MKKRSCPVFREKIVVVYPNSTSSDWTEKSQAFLAQQTMKQLGSIRSKRQGIKIDELHNKKNITALKPRRKISLIALHGHGKEADGSLMDITTDRIAIGPKNRKLMANRSVFAFYCYSSKLFLKMHKLSSSNLPTRWIGFRKELWLAGNRTGQTYRGFHESTWIGLRTLLTKQNAQIATVRMERAASKWITRWLCTLVISSLDRNFKHLRTSLLCCLGLLTMSGNIFFYDRDH